MIVNPKSSTESKMRYLNCVNHDVLSVWHKEYDWSLLFNTIKNNWYQDPGDDDVVVGSYCKVIFGKDDVLVFQDTYRLKNVFTFRLVEEGAIVRNVKPEKTSIHAFMRYLPTLNAFVEKKIANSLPGIFALSFDGWLAGNTHYVGLYASFSFNN